MEFRRFAEAPAGAARQVCDATLSVSKGSIYIVDDDLAMRDSLEMLLTAHGYDAKLFRDANEFLQAAQFLPFGILIVDLQMPGMDGLEMLDRLKQRKMEFPVVVITGFGNIGIAVKAMRAGAVDFVEKPFSDQIIVDSIDLAVASENAPSESSVKREVVAQRLTRLSPREHEVMTRMVAGNSNKITAIRLGLSPRTVEIHRARVMEKMQAKSLSELVRLAITAGINPES